MIIDLKNLKLLPFAFCFTAIVQASMTLSNFSMFAPLSFLCQGLVILGFLIMAAMMLRHPTVSLFDLAVYSFFILLILFSFIRRSDFKNAIYVSMNIWLVLLLFNYYRHNIKFIMQSFAIAFSFCIYANSFLPLLFPDIIFSANNVLNSFLLGGNHNQMGSRMIVAIAASLLCSHYNRYWLVNSVLLIVVSILTLSFVESMTSLAAIAAFAVIILTPSRQLKKVVAVGYLVFFILFQVFVVFSGEGLHNNELAVYVIEDQLGKDMTFTGRTTLWDASARVIANSPLIGYGYVDMDWYLANMATIGMGSHNFVYALLIYGGITLLGLFIFIFIVTLRKLLHKADSTALTLFMAIDTLLVMSLMETYPLFFIFFLLTLAYYYPRIRESWQKNDLEAEPDEEKEKALETLEAQIEAQIEGK